MVRKGSPVRVRQRALEKAPLRRGFSLPKNRWTQAVFCRGPCLGHVTNGKSAPTGHHGGGRHEPDGDGVRAARQVLDERPERRLAADPAAAAVRSTRSLGDRRAAEEPHALHAAALPSTTRHGSTREETEPLD